MLLHVIPSFPIGGVPLRTARLINHLGPGFRHTILALDGNYDAAPNVSAQIAIELMVPPRPRGMASNIAAAGAALRRLRPDILVTYNWGSIQWAMANRLFRTATHFHFEDGFGKEEADTQLRRRVLFRRWALARCKYVVVPSHRLLRIALDVWRLPHKQVVYVPNGVDADRFFIPRPELPGLNRRAGELIVGTLAPLRPEKNIGRLIQAFAKIDRALPARLVVAGAGTERPALVSMVRQMGIESRVTFTGRVPAESVLGGYDVFALSSDTEQMPVALLEAMAAGLPVAAVDVGDIKRMVCSMNRPFIVARDNEPALTAALERLLREPATRERLGRLNRERVVAEFPERRMFDRYSQLLLGGGA